ncbi:lipocalin family protein [Neisseriaceae bacterium B1]
MRTLKNFIAATLLMSVVHAYAAEPTTVAQVDVPRYMGKWHEIARLPMRFQDDCARDVQAVYTLNADKTVTVNNSCRRANGEMMSVEGQAKAVDATGSKLRVTFLPKAIRWLPVGKAPYWILRLDSDYQTALVGTPNRKYLWILSRSPQIAPDVYQSYLQTAREQGYAVDKLIVNPQ